jgi:hypothetical protein
MSFPLGGRAETVSVRTYAAHHLTSVRVERRGQDRPALTANEALARLREGAEPGAVRVAGRAGVVRKAIRFDILRVPAAFAENLIHAVPLLSPFGRTRFAAFLLPRWARSSNFAVTVISQEMRSALRLHVIPEAIASAR